MSDETRRRRSLTHVGGVIDEGGDARQSAALAHALEVAPCIDADSPDRAHVHGFHAYPARAHPVTIRRLIERFAPAQGQLLDPFCGSGTTLIEAMLAGRSALGTDINPLAVMLARAKTHPRKPEVLSALLAAANEVAAFADERRKSKRGATRRLPHEDVSAFAPHVLLELDGLRAGIEYAPAEARPDLKLVFSSILVKLSNTRGDTSDEVTEKRISAGYPARLFVRKTEEFATRLQEFAQELPSPAPRVRALLDDATKLGEVADRSIDAVITSPPYAATYDYVAHHALRLRWLKLDARRFERHELGARRRYARISPTEARARWLEELKAFFDALARVTKSKAPVVLLIADSATSRGPRGERPEALRAEELVAEAASHRSVFTPIARASQARPHFHAPTHHAFADRPRCEHVLLLQRT